MKVILVPDETSGRSSQSLTPRQVKLAVASVSFIVVASLAGAVSFATIAYQKTRQLEVAMAMNEGMNQGITTSSAQPAKMRVGARESGRVLGGDDAASADRNVVVTPNSTPSHALPNAEHATIASTLEAVEASNEEDDRVLIVARAIATIRHDITSYREAIQDVRNENDTHLSVLGARMGQLQAHISRLNALGSRLTDVAKLPGGEFNFDEIPAIGGVAADDEDAGRLSTSDALTGTLDRLDAELARSDSQLEVLEALIRDQELERARYPEAWPAEGGWVSSRFGKRCGPFSGRWTMHKGLDIAARHGTDIKAAAAGVVTRTGRSGNYGLLVEINHGNGYITRYGHASKILVNVGDKVDKGGVIAEMGNTGRSTGTHLHFEVMENDRHVDPRKLLGKLDKKG